MSIEGGAIDLSSCQKTVKWSCLLMQNQESACWFVDPSHFFPNLYLKNWKNDLIRSYIGNSLVYGIAF